MRNKILFFVLITSIFAFSSKISLATNKIVSVECKKIALGECLKSLEKAGQTTIDGPIEIMSKIVTVNFASAYLFEGLAKILNNANIENYTLSYDETTNRIVISLVSTSAKEIDDVVSERSPLDQSTSEKQAKTQKESDKYRTLGPKEMQSVATQQFNLDAEFDLPGGHRTTLRQMRSAQERADVYQPPQDARVFPQENSPTFQQLQSIMASGNKLSEHDMDLTMPGGKQINSKILRENSKQKNIDVHSERK